MKIAGIQKEVSIQKVGTRRKKYSAFCLLDALFRTNPHARDGHNEGWKYCCHCHSGLDPESRFKRTGYRRSPVWQFYFHI